MTLLPKVNTDIAKTDEGASGNQLVPVFLKLGQLHTVIIGAGSVGLEKLTAILTNSAHARITVIAKEVSVAVSKMAQAYDGLTILQKPFESIDLDNADIVIAATDDAELNNYVRQSARERKLLVNVADKPSLCDFY